MKKLVLLGCAIMVASIADAQSSKQIANMAVVGNEKTTAQEVQVKEESVRVVSVNETKLKACKGKGKNYCYNAEAAKCIPVKSYIDIKRDGDGMCSCVGAVATKNVMDNKNSSTVKDWDKKCQRRTSDRTRVYEIPVNFYCSRYFAVAGEADDFVSASSPSGIGTASKHDSWKEAHDNSINPAVSSSKIKKGTARLEVQDRWLREVGYNGYFYFPMDADMIAPGAGSMIVNMSWKKGHSRNKPVGKWVDKEGQAGCRFTKRQKDGVVSQKGDAVDEGEPLEVEE